MRKISIEEFENYSFVKTIVNKFNYGKEINCLCNPSTKEVFFFVEAPGLEPMKFDNLEDAILVFNTINE